MSKKQAPVNKAQQKKQQQLRQLKKEYTLPKRDEYADPGGDHFVPAKN